MNPRDFAFALLALLASCTEEGPRAPAVTPLELGDRVRTHSFRLDLDFLSGAEIVEGTWKIERDADGARIVQRAVDQAYPRLLLPLSSVRDVDVRLGFQARSGSEDASAGVVFGAREDRYFVVRANCLEHNFRLYLHDGKSRTILAGTRIARPELLTWHTLRVVVVRGRMQAYLDGDLLLDQDGLDGAEGRVGLWTKADAVTAFRDVEVRVPLEG